MNTFTRYFQYISLTLSVYLFGAVFLGLPPMMILLTGVCFIPVGIVIVWLLDKGIRR